MVFCRSKYDCLLVGYVDKFADDLRRVKQHKLSLELAQRQLEYMMLAILWHHYVP